jgi:hypothetical protein
MDDRRNDLPKEFQEGLRLIAEASRRMKRDGVAEPILVGGAVAEIYTHGLILSRDFDVTVPDQGRLEAELLALGFVRDDRSGSHRGLWHPKLKLGLEVVARVPFEGQYQAENNMTFETGNGPVILISVEDLIADRIAQFDADPRGDEERLMQAVYLYTGATDLDLLYLDRRIRREAHGRTLDWFVNEVEARARAKSAAPESDS